MQMSFLRCSSGLSFGKRRLHYVLRIVAACVVVGCTLRAIVNNCYLNRALISYDDRFSAAYTGAKTHYVGGSKEASDKLVSVANEYSSLRARPHRESPWLRTLPYRQILAKIATPDKTILIVPLQRRQEHVALNFFITSVAANGIENYLFVAPTPELCDRFYASGINCVAQENAVLTALQALYKVLYSTPDVLFLRNPFQHIKCSAMNCDLTAMFDEVLCDRFVYMLPSPFTITVLEKARKMAASDDNTLDAQVLFNVAVKKGMQESSIFRPVVLPKDLFQLSSVYQNPEAGYFSRTPDDEPCSQCAVVAYDEPGTAAKIFQLKEMHRWWNDNDLYYSSPRRKYILYHHPLEGWGAYTKELDALQDALAIGRVLDRTVIIPRFHVHCSERPLHRVVSFEEFDAVFSGKYRESTFLSHPLVSDRTQHSISKTFLIQTEYILEMAPAVRDLPFVHAVAPNNAQRGMTDVEVREHFGQREDPVLHFFAMYDSFWRFENMEEQHAFEEDISRAFLSYAQPGTFVL